MVACSEILLSAGEVENLLTLGCYKQAALLAEKTLSKGDPILIKALCQAGLVEKALDYLGEDNDSLEEVCWAYLLKGKNSTALFHRWVALQVATDLHSYRSVSILLSALQDSNIALRHTACGLSTMMRDAVLIQELKKIALQDHSQDVRLSAITALANIQAKNIVPLMVFDCESAAAEKRVILASLVTFRDKVEQVEIKNLVASNRAILRLFAINLVVSSGQKELIPLLFPLVNDIHPTVKMAFCEAAVILKQEKIPPIVGDEKDYRVIITQEWMRVFYGGSDKLLEQFLQNENSKARSLCAVALGKLGRIEALQARLLVERDLFVRLNIAEALLPYDQRAGQVIFEELSSYKGALIRSNKDSPALPLLLPSEFSRQELMNGIDANSEDLNIRMDLLHKLICKNSEGAMEALKSFLKEKRLSKAMLASFLLLQEGDEETAKMVQQLLYDQDPELSLQAALLLGGLFSDPEALFVLKSNYEAADLETRLRIIESLGRIGDKESIPFLKKQLKDPSLVIQILAAWAIVTAINK